MLASLGMLAALMAPALWNGFPLIFPDTGGYLVRPMEGTLGMGRSAFYGLFLYAGVPFTFWPNVVAQAAITAWLIVLTLRTHGFAGRPWLAFGMVAMLAGGSSLAWLASQLIPDILFPAAVLALVLLLFRDGQLARWERFALAAVIAVAMACHMAAAGMCVAAAAAVWLLARIRRLALPTPRLTFAAGAIAAGLALCPVSNWAITGTFAFTPGGSSFLFGRLIEDGIVARYLEERCPDPSLRLCAHKDALPEEADVWLWGETPFYKLGGTAGYGPEEREIIFATLQRYPLTHAGAAITAALRQFVSLRTEVSTRDNEPTMGTFEDRTPQLFAPFMIARQQTGGIDVDMLNRLHVPLAAFALAGLAGTLLYRRRLNVAPELAALCLTVMMALAANAAICGVFSHPVDRYQSRLMPLALLAIALVLLSRLGRRAAKA